MTQAENNTQQLQQVAQEAFENAPSLYVNGFVNGMGATDTYVVFQTNGQTSLVMNMSLSLAKTLGQSLIAQIERFEGQTGQTVLTMQQLSNPKSA
jgi:hypothetical protein